jgi:hypothetical protein
MRFESIQCGHADILPKMPVRVPANRPRCVRVLKYSALLLFRERGNHKEFNMYIGGGLLLLLIVLFLVLR